ncbi:MAG: helicase, partial [Pseudanabaena sp.]
NTSVHAEVVNDAASKQNDRAISLTTSAIPRHIVPNTTPPDEREIPALKGLILDMKVLAQVEAEALPPILDPLVNAYEQWLQVQQINKEQLPNSPSFYKQAADRNLKDCQEALKRIRAGIEILATNPQAVEAFQFMNAAMAQQRIHGLYAEQKR